jgi:hypothetical protein
MSDRRHAGLQAGCRIMGGAEFIANMAWAIY